MKDFSNPTLSAHILKNSFTGMQLDICQQAIDCFAQSECFTHISKSIGPFLQSFLHTAKKNVKTRLQYRIPQLFNVSSRAIWSSKSKVCLVRIFIYVYMDRQIQIIKPLLPFSTFNSWLQSHNGDVIFKHPGENEGNSMVCTVLEVGNLDASEAIQFQELVYILNNFIVNKPRF